MIEIMTEKDKIEVLNNIMRKRLKLKLNPLCFICWRVMIKKNKYEYYCVCNKDLIMSVG